MGYRLCMDYVWTIDYRLYMDYYIDNYRIQSSVSWDLLPTISTTK